MLYRDYHMGIIADNRGSNIGIIFGNVVPDTAIVVKRELHSLFEPFNRLLPLLDSIGF
jgi:hypothetical protein